MKRFLLVSLVIILFSSCKDKQNVNSDGIYPETIKVGHLVALDMAPLFIAKENGYFEEEGLDVETVFFSNPGDNNAALAGGSIQFSTNPFTLPYFGENSGVPMKIISSAGGLGIIEVIIQGSFGIEDLNEFIKYVKDESNPKVKIAALKGDTLEMIVLRMLEDNGLSYDDVEMIWFNDLLAMVQAFETKQVDLLSHIKPYTTDMIVNQNAVSLGNNSDVWGYGTPNCTVAVLDDFAGKYPKTIESYLRSLKKAFQFIVDNPDQAAEILDKGNYYKVDAAVLMYAFKNQPKEVVLKPNLDGMMIAINDMVELGYIKQPSKNILDTKFLDSIQSK